MVDELIVPVIDGRGLLGTEAEAAEFRREFADRVAIRPKALIALPVFYCFSEHNKNNRKKTKQNRQKGHALEASLV